MKYTVIVEQTDRSYFEVEATKEEIAIAYVMRDPKSYQLVKWESETRAMTTRDITPKPVPERENPNGRT